MGLDEMQKASKGNMEMAMKSFGAWSKVTQTIATEMADYSKKSFECGTAAVEKLLGAKTLDKAVEVQVDYLKSSYEDFVTEATKLGELYADLAKDLYKPFEGTFANSAATK